MLLAGVAIGLALRAVLDTSSRSDHDALPRSPVSYQALSSRPPAHLIYPGAQTLRVVGAGESRYPAEGVVNSAFVGAILSTADSPEQVYSWYRNHLTADGWKTYQLAALLSTQISAQGYQRGSREFFVVAIDDPRSLSAALGRQIPAGSTIVEFRYTIEATP